MSELKQEVSVSGWKLYGGIWLSLMFGMALSLCLLGRSELVLTFYSPLVMTLGCGSIIGLSAICAWGLLFLVPMGCIYHSWLGGRGTWWRLLPTAGLLMALLATLGVTLMGIQLPMAETGSIFEKPVEPSEEMIDEAYTLTVAAWKVCGRVCGILVALLVAQVLFVCGWSRTRAGVSSYWTAIRSHSRRLKEESARQEAEEKARKEALEAEKAAKKAEEAAKKAEGTDEAKKAEGTEASKSE